MPHVSIVVPAYNTLSTLPETVGSLLAQTYTDFEVIVVDDGSSDGTAAWVMAQTDPRVRLIRQVNRGLAGARNSGIAAAKGALIGLCDGDDLWEPEKLAAHVAFLSEHPEIGVSYSASVMVDAQNVSLGLTQTPKTKGVTASDILLRNPVGNGSAPVIRAATFQSIAYRPRGEARDWYFDETFRQSEDIECWMRIALTTDWGFGGLAAPLTRYRIIAGGLSANLERQFETWSAMADKVVEMNPGFAARWLPAAEAYQLRYLARRAVSLGDGATAARLLLRAARASWHPMMFEPKKTLTTLAATTLMLIGGAGIVSRALHSAKT
jgi:hypothetical protein